MQTFCKTMKWLFSHFSAFASMIPPVPVKVLAVTESGGANAFFSNDFAASLITEGNALADRIHASFTTTCPNFQQQSKHYARMPDEI